MAGMQKGASRERREISWFRSNQPVDEQANKHLNLIVNQQTFLPIIHQCIYLRSILSDRRLIIKKDLEVLN